LRFFRGHFSSFFSLAIARSAPMSVLFFFRRFAFKENSSCVARLFTFLLRPALHFFLVQTWIVFLPSFVTNVARFFPLFPAFRLLLCLLLPLLLSSGLPPREFASFPFRLMRPVLSAGISPHIHASSFFFLPFLTFALLLSLRGSPTFFSFWWILSF